ncbi:transmembrane protein 14C-like [Macrosteles quadrilineatus]|uniref:transmembrane protein 14C-like n=1 Tax=Macrosteles quadrilineatus TaxID=74068 RepID=UPI0023E0FDB2|nr:transmembrane protein 14C-like [Macrosteles quadrilineatus]
MAIDYISFAYAASVAAGGIIGYVKAGSIPSLGAGLLFGSVLGFGAYQTSQNPNNYYTLLGTSTVLGGVMGARFYNSGRFMPAGLITVLSVMMICRLGVRALGLNAMDNFTRDK